MERFTIHQDYYNVLKRLKKRSDRAVVALAILEFAFEELEPNDLTEAGDIAFESIRQTLEKSRNNSGRGGRKMKNRMETDLKPIDNRIATELQPNYNRMETDLNQEKNTLPQKERSKEKYTPSPKKESPLFIPPKMGGEKNEFADRFFEKYPRYAKDRAKMRVDVDYERLLAEFEKSSWLRSLYTVKQINENYVGIIAGDYRDQEKKVDGITAGREYMAERERYYTALRDEEERKVEAVVKKLMTYPRYAEIDKRLRSIEIDAAKAELKGDKPKMAKLEMERQRLRMERNNILSNNGLEEEDITVKRHCHECNDTGWLGDGTVCSCYKGD